MKHLAALAAIIFAALGTAAVATAGDHPDNVTICHAAGLAGTTHYETLTIGYEAVYGPAGHFYENGTPQAGHEQDYLGECREEPPPPVDVCPNLEGDQAEVPAGYHLDENKNCVKDETQPATLTAGVTFTEATCTTPPAVQLAKTNIPGIGLRPFYSVEGPDFVDGHPVAGGTYTFTAIPVAGYEFTGQTVFTHTFAPTPTNCGQTHVVTGTASVICDSGAKLYRLSGTVDGQTADKVDPATLPGNTVGVSNVTVTRGDTSVRTTVTTLGDCAPATTTVTTPPTVTAPPAVAAPPVAKPAAKPAAKPKVKKPVVKPKPKPHKRVVTHKPNKKPHKAPKTL